MLILVVYGYDMTGSNLNNIIQILFLVGGYIYIYRIMKVPCRIGTYKN